MTDRQIVHTIRTYITDQGYTCQPGLVENYYLSLRARPFVLLGGNGAMDMTLLPRLFAQAVGATEENGRYLQLRVRPDWMDSSDMFGCLDLSGKFVPGVIMDFLKAAQLDPERPYFLCLDRVLLDRAEYYLSEILGSVESREQPDRRKPLVTMAYYGRDQEAADHYGVIPALDNLYIVGTIAMEETSRPLNQRFLDRVHMLELTPQALCPGEASGALQPLEVSNDFLLTRYFRLDQCPDALRQTYFELFEPLNRCLFKAKAYLSFRLRNDGILYLMHNRDAAVLDEKDALDHVICMKVLTRIQGSDKVIRPVLEALLEQCPEYENTMRKLRGMLHRCDEGGYASFWD